MPKAKEPETAFDSPEFDAETAALDKLASTGLIERDRGVTMNYTPTDFDDAIRYLEEMDGEVVVFEGNPYHVVDKKFLVGKPFIFMGYRINNGDQGQFVSVMGISKEPVPDNNGTFCNRFVINDGSTGIRDQVIALHTTGKKRAGFFVPNGLRVSEYEIDDPTGELDKDGNPKQVPAKTYYIA